MMGDLLDNLSIDDVRPDLRDMLFCPTCGQRYQRTVSGFATCPGNPSPCGRLREWCDLEEFIRGQEAKMPSARKTGERIIGKQVFVIGRKKYVYRNGRFRVDRQDLLKSRKHLGDRVFATVKSGRSKKVREFVPIALAAYLAAGYADLMAEKNRNGRVKTEAKRETCTSLT